ncbi:hypothetical protein FOZ63_020388, partial [Perkinsus olseni]
GGMGPGENGKSKVLTSPGSCVYIMKGRNRDGVQQESVGFKLASDRRLSDGALEVQLNLVQDDSDEGPRSFEAASDQSFSAIPVISLRRKGRGWTYQVALQVKGSLGAYKDLFSHMVAIT